MLKPRITASVIVKGGKVVQSIGFDHYLPVGSVAVVTEFLNSWGIDEIILLDIEATQEGRGPDFDLITKISSKIFVPLTVGGGVKNLDDMRKLIGAGADKFSMNTAALKNKNIIKEAAEVFGAQCVVVCIDVMKNNEGTYEVYTDSGKTGTKLDPVAWAKETEQLGAGEILLQSINQDGSKQGYDTELTKSVASAVNIPVIALGGARKPSDFKEALDAGALAAAAGNFFHFTEHSPIIVKSFLKKNGIDVRLDTQATYEDFEFDERLERIKKKPDSYLEKSRFEYIPEEKI